MDQFYAPNKVVADWCLRACDEKKPVTVSGVDCLEGKVKAYHGVVRSVEDRGPSKQSRRWRVTILDENEVHRFALRATDAAAFK